MPCYRLGPRATRFTRELLDDFAAARLDRGRSSLPLARSDTRPRSRFDGYGGSEPDEAGCYLVAELQLLTRIIRIDSAPELLLASCVGLAS